MIFFGIGIRRSLYAAAIAMALFHTPQVFAVTASDLQVGKWVAVSSNTVSSVNPCPGNGCNYSGNEGQKAVMDDWSAQIGAQTATQLMDRGDMSVLTRRLVDAMDWTSIGDYMVEPWEAEKIVKAIFDGTLTLGFPTPPSEVFASQEYSNDDLFSPLLKVTCCDLPVVVLASLSLVSSLPLSLVVVV